MTEAPQDGTTIFLRAVWGAEPDDGEISFEGEAQWRTEQRPALTDDPLGRPDIPAHESTGWMRSDSQYRVPGRPVGWWL